MKLPNGDRAVVDKLRDYCLNPHHPHGRNKARLSRGARVRSGRTPMSCGPLCFRWRHVIERPSQRKG
jgi:hypothetical protein